MSTRIDTMEELFKALADGTRLRILGLLLTGEVCVCDIHESLKKSRSKASRHLAYLRRAGLVGARKEGLWMHYRLTVPQDAVLRTILDAVTHCLGHVPTAARDAERLHTRTGCCAVAETHRPELACCAPATGVPVELHSTRGS